MRRSLANVKLRQVRYFLAVAEALNFTRAAERLGATQPTLSHQIGELEAMLGTPLFERGGRSLRLTAAGTLFQTFATRAVRQFESGLLALSELEGLMRGALRLGVIQSLTHTLLPPVFLAFAARHPAIEVCVTEKSAREIEADLAAGRFDLGIAFAPALDEEIEVEPVLQEELLLLVGADHALAAHPVVEMSRLGGVKMILLDRSYSTRRLVDRYLEQAGARPDVVCTTNSMAFMLATAGHDDVATIIPERAFDARMYPLLRSVRLRQPTPVRTSALLWPRYGLRTAAANAFADLVRSHLGGTRVDAARAAGT